MYMYVSEYIYIYIRMRNIYIEYIIKAKALWNKDMDKEMIRGFSVFTNFSLVLILSAIDCFDELENLL